MAAGERYLTFRLDRRLYALPAGEVTEIIRLPAVARVPQGPPGLMGLANLRGAVLPVASLRGLLDDHSPRVETRAIVLEGAAPVALAVDGVETLVTVEVGELIERQADLAAEPGERLRGAIRSEGGAIKVLDIQALLAGAFTPRARTARPALAAARALSGQAEAKVEREKFVTFQVAGQDYALSLASVREIVTPPENLALVPRGEALVLGVAGYRDTLLPVFSLRGLLGFAPAAVPDGREKVLVVRLGDVLVGLLADRMQAILSPDPDLVEPPPPALAARAGGESRIKAIYRGEGGKRLVSILAPEQLFREDVMQRLGEAAAPQRAADTALEGETLQLLVFRLGEDEFGLPIGAVDEVAPVPDQITRLPRTPKFLEGVINLRGEVLPVVDQRRRFDMPPLADPAGRRLVVVRSGAHRAGLIVDSVSEVLRASTEAVGPAPDLAGEPDRLVTGVLNLEATGRLVLVLDPAELLSRAERGLLDAFTAKAKQKPS